MIELEIRPKLELIADSAIHCRTCFNQGGLESSYVDITQPRYIGAGYWQSKIRIAFLMLNPGAGNDGDCDREWRQELYAYQSGNSSLESVFATQRKHMPHWGRGKLIPFVELHGLDVDKVALINVAWCASKDNKYPKWMLSKCMKRHTLRWIATIDPAIIILSGTSTHSHRSALEMVVPAAKFHQTFHYAHRPRDAERAEARASKIRQLLSESGSIN